MVPNGNASAEWEGPGSDRCRWRQGRLRANPRGLRPHHELVDSTYARLAVRPVLCACLRDAERTRGSNWNAGCPHTSEMARCRDGNVDDRRAAASRGILFGNVSSGQDPDDRKVSVW